MVTRAHSAGCGNQVRSGYNRSKSKRCICTHYVTFVDLNFSGYIRSSVVHNKLGVLWTWDFDPHSRQPIYTVLGAEEVHETVPMVPRWEPNTANWSIKRGVFRNRFLRDAQTRPLFSKQCQCLD